MILQKYPKRQKIEICNEKLKMSLSSDSNSNVDTDVIHKSFLSEKGVTKKISAE